MQIYDGLPIITNKITVEEQQGIPHHLLGAVALDKEPWRVGVFKRKAGKIIKEIRSRGRTPILVGGTHYYTQSLLFNDTLVSDADKSEGETESYVSRERINSKYPILERPTG
jgi:tRNA dimethylallyltransferase